MIVKGRARSGPQQLAAYLLRQDGKERATLIELHDGSDDLKKAFTAWDAIGEATRGEKTLYHAQIAPEARYQMTPDQWKRAAEILAQELGMERHPRAIVVHEGSDKPHAHVVFQRTDAATLTMWDDSFNYLKHERASLAMEKEFAHEHIPGKHAKRDREKQPEFPRAASDRNDHQQAERTELTVEERKEQVTALRARSDNAQAFRNALEEAGYILARGDKRGLVIVDEQGEVYSLSRQVTDLKGKEFKAFMDGIDPAKLPTAEEAKAVQAAPKPAPAENAQGRGVEASKFVTPETTSKTAQPAPASPTAAQGTQKDEKLAALEKALADRQAEEARKVRDLHAHQLRQKEFELDRELKEKLSGFEGIQNEQRAALKERHAEQRTGIEGFLHALKLRLNPALAAEETNDRRKESLALEKRLERERTDYLKLLQQTKAQDLDNLKERQAQERRDNTTRNAEERDRYIREHKEAEKIREQLRDQREREKTLDPPTRTK